MPIYEYECNSCHHHFDLMQKVTDSPVEQCPHCLQNSVIRLISAAGFQLKGTGWYVTDFKNKGTKLEKNSKEEKSETSSTEKQTTSAPADSQTEKNAQHDKKSNEVSNKAASKKSSDQTGKTQ